MAARALRAARKADTDRADETVLVQMQHHARALRACRRQRAPAERGMQIVGMHDTRAAEAHRAFDFARLEAPAQKPDRRTCARAPGRVAGHELGGLAEPLTHERHEILDDTLLATGAAIAVV